MYLRGTGGDDATLAGDGFEVNLMLVVRRRSETSGGG